MNDPLVVFQPSGKRGRFPAGTPVLDAARSLGVYVESVCGGRGICGKCKVTIAEGHFAKFGIDSAASHLSPLGAIEARYDEKRGLDPGLRLSCAATVTGNIVIDIPDAFRVAGQTIRKDASTFGMIRNPAVRLCYAEVPDPDMPAPVGDADRLCRAVETGFGLKNVTLAFAALPLLQPLLAAHNRELTCAVRMDTATPEIVALFPGYTEELTGLAVDIGSTTIAAHLVDLMTGEILASRGVANPQIRFGEDLMSRVSYVMMNEGGRTALTDAVRAAINSLVAELLATAGRPRVSLLDAVFVGNPIMHHLFLGLDPTPLGQAPFALAQSGSVHCRADEIGIDLGSGGRVYLLPLIAGHVGADAAAVLLSQQPEAQPHPTLVVDVGTNAEIMLWDAHALYAASSPTGPAFEGAEISAGQRAAPGAIERVRIDRQTLAARYRVIGGELWSNEPGFAEAVKTTGVTGICGSGIIEAIGEMLLAGILAPDGIVRAPRTDAEAQKLVAHGRTWSYVLAEAP
ncbi:MAG: ASKHA domain-containing protein, partial [Cucumibacter sp.]